jgi:SAM-dependent methyltransferase
MLGVATSALTPGAFRWIERTWGCADIHARQKWNVMWPLLSRLPRSKVRLLDAGCGSGKWALEIAARRPNWTITGVDYDAHAISIAESGRQRLGLTNVSFRHDDFLEFQPSVPFDLILSVASAHYLVDAGQGERLFRRFNAWLAPGGQLLLLGPRHAPEVPTLSFLGALPSQRGFRGSDLEKLCHASGLAVDSIDPEIGRLGTLAKQVAVSAGKSGVARLCAYPFEVALTAMDKWIPLNKRNRSAVWVLAGRKALVL